MIISKDKLIALLFLFLMFSLIFYPIMFFDCVGRNLSELMVSASSFAVMINIAYTIILIIASISDEDSMFTAPPRIGHLVLFCVFFTLIGTLQVIGLILFSDPYSKTFLIPLFLPVTLSVGLLFYDAYMIGIFNKVKKKPVVLVAPEKQKFRRAFRYDLSLTLSHVALFIFFIIVNTFDSSIVDASSLNEIVIFVTGGQMLMLATTAVLFSMDSILRDTVLETYIN